MSPAVAPDLLAALEHVAAIIDKTIDDATIRACNAWLDAHRPVVTRLAGHGHLHASKADAQTVLVWRALSGMLGIALALDRDANRKATEPTA